MMRCADIKLVTRCLKRARTPARTSLETSDADGPQYALTASLPRADTTT